jgi:hypothetical protein
MANLPAERRAAAAAAAETAAAESGQALAGRDGDESRMSGSEIIRARLARYQEGLARGRRAATMPDRPGTHDPGAGEP